MTKIHQTTAKLELATFPNPFTTCTPEDIEYPQAGHLDAEELTFWLHSGHLRSITVCQQSEEVEQAASYSFMRLSTSSFPS
jgi:hypothetical protein